MNAEERQRFEKLIQFLDQLSPEKFNFGMVVEDWDAKDCGTICCAIGWTPAIFPELVQWCSSSIELYWSGGLWMEYADIASLLFGLPPNVAGLLFCPKGQKTVHRKLQTCGPDASPQEVAAMLREFLELWDSDQISEIEP